MNQKIVSVLFGLYAAGVISHGVVGKMMLREPASYEYGVTGFAGRVADVYQRPDGSHFAVGAFQMKVNLD